MKNLLITVEQYARRELLKNNISFDEYKRYVQTALEINKLFEKEELAC